MEAKDYNGSIYFLSGCTEPEHKGLLMAFHLTENGTSLTTLRVNGKRFHRKDLADKEGRIKDGVIETEDGKFIFLYARGNVEEDGECYFELANGDKIVEGDEITFTIASNMLDVIRAKAKHVNQLGFIGEFDNRFLPLSKAINLKKNI